MPKKLTSLAEELKQLTVRCEIVDDLAPALRAYVELACKRQLALLKLSQHIAGLRRAGASGSSTADFAEDPTVQKSIRDILKVQDQMAPAFNRYDMIASKLAELVRETSRLIAKAEDLVRTLPELKPVVAGAKELLRALAEFSRPGHRRTRRLYFK